MVASLGSLQIDIALATGGLERQLADLEARLGTISSNLGNVGTGAANASTGMQGLATSIATTTAGFDLIGSAAKTAFSTIKGYADGGVNLFKSFEGGLNSFKAISGATDAEVAALSETALKLAKDTTKTAPEVAKAATELSKLGYSAKDTNKELGGLVALAEAAGISVDQAATIVGAGSNVFQRSAKDIANIVSATANATAADANDMLQAFSKAGGVFKANNQDLETLSATFGLLRQSGFSAETAGTALKTSITRLAAPSKKGKAALDELGISVRDGTGNMKNFIDLIPEFRAGLEKANVADRAQLTNDIFGAEAGPAVTGLLGTNQEKIDSVRQTITAAAAEGTAAQETAAKLISGFSGSLEQLSGSLETIQLKVGSSLSPILTLLAQNATVVANAFISLPAPLQSVAIGFVGAAAAAAGLVTAIVTLNTLQIGTKLAEGAAQAQNLLSGAAKAASSFDLLGASSTQGLQGIISNSGAAVGNLTKLAGVAGLAVLAGYALTEAWRGFQLATGNDASTAAINASTAALQLQIEEVQRGRGEIELIKSDLAAQNAESSNLFSVENIQGYFEELLKTLADGGPIELLQNLANDAIGIFFELDAQLAAIFAGILSKLNDMVQSAGGIINLLPGGKAATGLSQSIADAATTKATEKRATAEDVKKNGFLTTNSDREAQNNLEAIGKLQAQVNTITDDGTKVLAKYGMVQSSAANADKLSAQEKVKFQEEAKKQIGLYDASIAALKKIEPANKAQKATIDAEVSALEKTKKAYQDRVSIVEKSASATEKATVAQVAQTLSLEDESSQVLSKLRADVAEQVAAGQITEEQGQQQILDKEREFLDKRIALNKEKIAELLELKKAGASGSDLIKIDEQLASLNKDTNELREKSARNKIQSQGNAKKASASQGGDAAADAEKAKREAQDKAAKAEQFLQLQEQSALKIGESSALNQVRQGVLGGSIDESEAAAKTADIKSRSAGQELSIEQNKLSRLRAMAQSGLVDKERAASEELQIGQRLAQLELAQTDARIAVQEAARKKILEDIERANRQAESALRLNVTEQTAAVRSQQATGGLTDQQAEAKIAEISQRQTLASYELVQQKIAQTQKLRADGTITEKQAQDQLMGLEQERADINLQRIAGELAARKRLQEEQIKAIDDEAKRSIGTLQAQQGAINATINGLRGQQELMSAQQGLTQAQDALALQQMEARGATEAEITAYKNQIIEREQSHAMQMLDLSIQMRELEAERELRSARIAEIEARIAISKATINGASQQEIDLLTEALHLREQNVKEAETAIDRQAKIGDIQKETLATQQQAEREKIASDAQKKSADEAKKKTESDKTVKASAGGGGASDGGGASGAGAMNSMSLFGEDIIKSRTATDRILQLQKEGATKADFAREAMGIAGNNEFFLQRLQEMGMGDIVNLANADKANMLSMDQKNKVTFGGENGFADLLNELKSLNGNVTGALREPKSISVSTATPTSDLLNIMGSSRKKRG